MYISNQELKTKRVLWNKEYSIGYQLENGLIIKKFQNLSLADMNLKIDKIMLANHFQRIKELAAPVDILTTEDGICGFLQEPKEGTHFPNHCNSFPMGIPLDEIIQYITLIETIIRKCHEEEMYFPDLASDGNVLYDPLTRQVSIIDYDDAQIKGLRTSKINSIIYLSFRNLLDSPKYFYQQLYNKNIDIFTLAFRFFYYATKINLGKNIRNRNDLEFFIKYTGLNETTFAENLRLIFDYKEPNHYISESLKELSDNYILTPNELGKPRTFRKIY